jgi:hypothetical protein
MSVNAAILPLSVLANRKPMVLFQVVGARREIDPARSISDPSRSCCGWRSGGSVGYCSHPARTRAGRFALIGIGEADPASPRYWQAPILEMTPALEHCAPRRYPQS